MTAKWAALAALFTVMCFVGGCDRTGSQPTGLNFHDALKSGSIAAVKYHLAQGADVNAIMQEAGWTPLTLAAAMGHLRLVKFLLSRGADIDGQSARGWTPLYAAATSARPKIARLLLGRGAEVNVRTHEGTTPLTAARATVPYDPTGDGRATVDLLRKHGGVE